MTIRDSGTADVGATATRVRNLLRSGAYLASVAPIAVTALVTSLPEPEGTYRRWARLVVWKRGVPQAGPRACTRPALLGHAVASVLVGLVGWVLLAVIGLMIARGALYGLVDGGPYDDSWGGPSRAGAWLAHFAISVPVAAGAALCSVGVANLHVRMTRRLHGEPMAWWAVPVVLILCGAAALFVVGWIRQL